MSKTEFDKENFGNNLNKISTINGRTGVTVGRTVDKFRVHGVAASNSTKSLKEGSPALSNQELGTLAQIERDVVDDEAVGDKMLESWSATCDGHGLEESICEENMGKFAENLFK